jgi:hypothetical protein
MTHATSGTLARSLSQATESRLPSTDWTDLFAQIYVQRNPRIFRPPFDSRRAARPANPASRTGSIMKNGRLRSEPL